MKKLTKSLFKLIKFYLGLAFLSTLTVSCAINNHQTAGTFAPQASQFHDAVIQVYAARTKGAKKIVSVHTWISVKPDGSQEYTSYEIIGWRLRRNNSALVKRTSSPDRSWWGNQPELLLDIRGEKAQQLIPQVLQAIEDYPFKETYQAWPGPNSNTFTAFIGKKVPQLGLDLPSTAIGKDYREIKDVVGLSPSGSGVQASLWGLLGISLGIEEGLELNFLGLNFEFDLLDFAVELPGVGRIGASDVEEYQPTTSSPKESFNTVKSDTDVKSETTATTSSDKANE